MNNEQNIKDEEISNCDLQEQSNIKEQIIEKELKIQTLQKELQDFNDKYIRIVAEYDNYRKRSSKERELLFNNISSEIIFNFLEIYDNITLAIKSNEKNDNKGIELILKKFETILKNLNVEKIEANPKTKFDPKFHDAIVHIKDENFGENEIIETLKIGFKIGDKIIRHATVKVAN